MHYRIALLVAAMSPFMCAIHAQHSDAQVLKDTSWPGVLRKELRPGSIKKVWSSANKQYFRDRVNDNDIALAELRAGDALQG